MRSLLTVDIEQISIDERIQLAEELWDSILANPEKLPMTEAQKQELDNRLKNHQQTGTEGLSWEAVKENTLLLVFTRKGIRRVGAIVNRHHKTVFERRTNRTNADF